VIASTSVMSWQRCLAELEIRTSLPLFSLIVGADMIQIVLCQLKRVIAWSVAMWWYVGRSVMIACE
jgi:hypothetical protein